jgi:hypothetical protein
VKRLVSGGSWEDRGTELKEDLMRAMEETCTNRCEDVGFRLSFGLVDGSEVNPCGGYPGARKTRRTNTAPSTESTQMGAGTEASGS